jgi:hypothetical protein
MSFSDDNDSDDIKVCIAAQDQDIGIGLVNLLITIFRAQPIYIITTFTWRTLFTKGKNPYLSFFFLNSLLHRNVQMLW